MAGGRHNNTDLRYGFPLAGESVDLVAASDRNTNQIDVYAIDPATRLLRPVGSIQTSIDVYGFAMYHSPSSGRFYGIVSSNTKLQQWEFVGQSDGTVAGVLVRTFVTTSVIEGMVADEELGFLYVAEENHGIYK